eukprot:816163-Amphidinium_carterae.1
MGVASSATSRSRLMLVVMLSSGCSFVTSAGLKTNLLREGHLRHCRQLVHCPPSHSYQRLPMPPAHHQFSLACCHWSRYDWRLAPADYQLSQSVYSKRHLSSSRQGCDPCTPLNVLVGLHRLVPYHTRDNPRCTRRRATQHPF